jgi:hypothetical protein
MSELIQAARHLLHLHACEQEGLSAGQPTPEQWTEAVNALSDAVKARQTSRQNGELEVDYRAMIGALRWDACEGCAHYRCGCDLATGEATERGFMYTDGDFVYCKDYKPRREGESDE